MIARLWFYTLTRRRTWWAAFLAVVLLSIFSYGVLKPALTAARSHRDQDAKRRAAAWADWRSYTQETTNRTAYARPSPADGTCFLTRQLERPEMPTVHSAFVSPESNSVVFVGVRFLADKWDERFVCEFPMSGELTPNDPVVDDYRSFGYFPQYAFVMTCPLPAAYRGQDNITVSLHKETWRRPWFHYSYINVTVCRGTGSSSSPAPKRRFLSVCTMVKDMDDFIPDWLDYHMFLGVEHAYIYNNAPEATSRLRETVREYIASGFVTVIPWSHPPSPTKTFHQVQMAHENDCLWRHRHDTHWMMKIDVDEYVQPMNSSRPRIPDYLREPRLDSLGGVLLQNWFFSRPNPNESPPGSIIERNRWRPEEPTQRNVGKDKNILRPVNVHYFKVHAIKLGGDVRSLDPRTELRLVHYRADNPRARYFHLPKFTVLDESMVRLWQRVKEAKRRGSDSARARQ